MPLSLITVIGSGITLLLFVLLFRVEDRRDVRFLKEVRTYSDRFILSSRARIQRVSRFLERDLFRQTLHFFFHTVLATILRFLEQCAERLRKWQRSNKKVALRSREERSANSHFDEISKHKIATALTSRERKKAKEKAIGERL